MALKATIYKACLELAEMRGFGVGFVATVERAVRSFLQPFYTSITIAESEVGSLLA
jgi:hypothetical protein